MLKNLKDYRINHGYTHQSMADLLGISKAFYWQIENSKRNLSYKMSIKIANIFEAKPDDIFYDDYKNKKDK